MPRSILDAIKQGDWSFEPGMEQPVNLKATKAMPGTPEKLDVLAERLKRGEPLWIKGDRPTYDDEDRE